MITVHLTANEAYALIKFTDPACERWPGEAALKRAVEKLDSALLAYEENNSGRGA